MTDTDDTDAQRQLLPEPACPDCGQVDPIDAITAVVPGLCCTCIADRITVARDEPAGVTRNGP